MLLHRKTISGVVPIVSTYTKFLFLTIVLGLTLISNIQAQTVVTNNGTGTGTVGTLDWALANVPSGGTITFSGAMTIVDNSLTIPSNVTIDASYANLCTNGPRILIQTSPGSPAALTYTGVNNVIIKGISFAGLRFVMSNCNNFDIYGCWFNLNGAGTAALTTHNYDWSGSAFAVTYNSGSINCNFGGPACDERNVMPLNDGTNAHGLRLDGVSSITVANSFFGTDKNGTTGLAKDVGATYSVGISVNASSDITISDNVICVRNDGGAGNETSGDGIYITGTNSDFDISGNKIGVDVNGAVQTSIWIRTAPIAITGTLNSSTISNNILGKGGYLIDGTIEMTDYAKNSGIYLTSTSNVNNLTISSNRIGVTATNTSAGNAFCGIYFNGGTTDNMTISGNTIGFNGFGASNQYGSGIAMIGSNVKNIDIYSNYIGTTSASTDAGNANDGIIMQSGPNNITIGGVGLGNYICFNDGRRVTPAGGGDPTYVREPNAAIMMHAVNNITIQGNSIGRAPNGNAAGQSNVGGSLVGGSGIVAQSSNRIEIGGMNAGEQNTIAHNSGRGIMVIWNSDYVEMRWNSIFCNTGIGIDINCAGNYGIGASNGGYGCTGFTLNTFTPLVSSVSGTRPTGGTVDVFGTNSCATGACNKQGEYRYATGTYGGAGTTWNYNHGSNMLDDISATVTGSGGDCNSGFCRTSEYTNCVDNQLPVTWLLFDAFRRENHVALIWHTASEKDNAYFVIERSVDGKNFSAVGRVASKNVLANEYNYQDYLTMATTLYYRIKQVDINGQYSYSPVRVVVLDEKEIILYPNPASDLLNVLLNSVAGEQIQISFINVLGHEVKFVNYVATGGMETIQVETSSLVAGIYIVRIQQTDSVIYNTIQVK